MAKLVLVRHGQSVWNLLNEFTGWVDVPLTKEGDEEARSAAARLLNIKFDVAFTSQLIRAHQTLCVIFQERVDRILVFKHNAGKEALWEHYSNAKQWEVPVFKAMELNERHYGDLQGLNKQDTIEKYGAIQVQQWRRSYDVKPPGGESLADTIARAAPYFENHIFPFVKHGENVIVVAHHNSLRGIIMHLEKLTPEQVVNVELATGVPVVYDIDSNGAILNKQIAE